MRLCRFQLFLCCRQGFFGGLQGLLCLIQFLFQTYYVIGVSRQQRFVGSQALGLPGFAHFFRLLVHMGLVIQQRLHCGLHFFKGIKIGVDRLSLLDHGNQTRHLLCCVFFFPFGGFPGFLFTLQQMLQTFRQQVGILGFLAIQGDAVPLREVRLGIDLARGDLDALIQLLFFLTVAAVHFLQFALQRSVWRGIEQLLK